MSLKAGSKLLISAALIAASSVSTASEGGFVGLHAGLSGGGLGGDLSGSLDTDQSSSSFKILGGAHITNRLTLELAYMNLGESSFDDPTPINASQDNKDPISFKNAGHGEVSIGPVGDVNAIDDEPDTYPNKNSSTFVGISKFETQGALINLRYRFPLMDSLDFFVKTGFFAWEATFDQIEIEADQSEDGSDEAIITKKTTRKGAKTSAVNAISGGGFLYYPRKDISVRLELESTAIDSLEMPRSRFQNLTLGASWEF